VLAAYRNEPHKYAITSDYFEGTLTVTDEYYRELEAAERTNEYVNVRFGYRTLSDGNLALAAWLPDLFERSKAHVEKWAAFHLRNPQWTAEPDERFRNWLQRYVQGSWDVDNGPLFYVGEEIKTINGLTSELVGTPLYKHEIDQTLGYPAAENTHRYQDAHRALYGYFIDGIDKKCISALASKLGRTVPVDNKKTIAALARLLPGLNQSEGFGPAVARVSEQRRLASHGARPKAVAVAAFSKFTEDLRLCLKALKEVTAMLEKEFHVNGEEMRKRHEAKKWLPVIVRSPSAHFSIVGAKQMAGKTVERVEIGFREDIEGVHGSEAMIVYFTDGSIMGLDTGSNAANVAAEHKGLQASEFHVDFMVQWVPESRRKGSESV